MRLHAEHRFLQPCCGGDVKSCYCGVVCYCLPLIFTLLIKVVFICEGHFPGQNVQLIGKILQVI